MAQAMLDKETQRNVYIEHPPMHFVADHLTIQFVENHYNTCNGGEKRRAEEEEPTKKPKVEPKVNKQPRAEKPKAEKPKAEKPKAEKPKVEKPKTEKPKANKKPMMDRITEDALQAVIKETIGEFNHQQQPDIHPEEEEEEEEEIPEWVDKVYETVKTITVGGPGMVEPVQVPTGAIASQEVYIELTTEEKADLRAMLERMERESNARV